MQQLSESRYSGRSASSMWFSPENPQGSQPAPPPPPLPPPPPVGPPMGSRPANMPAGQSPHSAYGNYNMQQPFNIQSPNMQSFATMPPQTNPAPTPQPHPTPPPPFPQAHPSPFGQPCAHIPPQAGSVPFAQPPFTPHYMQPSPFGDACHPQEGGAGHGTQGSKVATRDGDNKRTPAEILAGRKAVKGGAAADAEHIAKAHLMATQHGFDVGPIRCGDAASLKRYLTAQASDPTKGGGGWGIHFNTQSSDVANSRCALHAANCPSLTYFRSNVRLSSSSRGLVRCFGCDRAGAGRKAGKHGVNCSWSMSYEDSSEGWVLFSYQPNHVVRGETDDDGKPVVAHKLEQDLAAVRARAT